MKKITQKALSLLLSFAMLFGMVQGAAVPAFAEIEKSVSIGGVTVADSSWYAKTDANGTVTQCAETDDWNVHVVKDSSPPATATVTLKNATIENPSGVRAIETIGYNLNIVLEGTENKIGTGSEYSNGYAIYNSTANNIKITGEGDLTVKGRQGIEVMGTGTVKIDTTGSLNIASKVDMICTGGSLTVSAKSITANGLIFDCGAVSLTATDGDVSITGSGSNTVRTSSSGVTVAAPKGAVSLSGGQNAINTAYDNEVRVSAKNDITMTGTVKGAKVSAASETGDVTINGYNQAINGAKTSVTVTAPQGNVKLTSGNGGNVLLGSGYTFAVTAASKLDATGSKGIEGYANTAIKADTVRVVLTDVGYGFDGGALTITNPEGGNCSEVFVSGGGKGSDAIQSSGDVTVKANQVVVAANIDADPYYGTQAIDATGDVTIGDTGIIVGEFTVGTNHIAAGVVQASQNGGDKSGGLDLYTGTPTQSTYYKAGNGYALFTPKNGGTPAKLILHNATIHNTTKLATVFGPEHEGIALPAEPVTLQAEGANKIISYEGDGIGYGTNLTLSGDGTLTVEKTKCGIRLENGSFAFADGAKVTLNSTVTDGDDSHIVSTVYGNVKVESTSQFNAMSLIGAVTIAKGATLTVPKGQALWLDGAISITNNGTIINNGTIYLPYDYTVEQIQALNLPGSILLFDMTNDKYKAYVNGSIYACSEINGDLDLTTPPAEVTYYKADNGYLIFTPANDGTSASLTLHNVDLGYIIYLPNAPVTLYLEGTNKAYDIEAANALTVSGSGSLDGFICNTDSAASLTVNSGAALNILYQTTDNNGVVTDTVYGSYTTKGETPTVSSDRKWALAPGAVLTLTEDGCLEFEKDTPLSSLTIGAGASIVNNTHATLPQGTKPEQIAALPLSGTGVVRVATAYDEYGWASAWDTYMNDGTALKTVSGDLDLTTGGDTGATLENDGYAWDGSTLTLGSVCIDGNITLPDNQPVRINTTENSFISGSINGAGSYHIDFTFTGTALLTVNGSIGGFTNDDTVTVQNGAQVRINGVISIGDFGTDGTLNVTGAGSSLSVSSPYDYAVLCGTLNVGNGASLTVKADSIGVVALTGVNVTGGATLTAGCDYGVYIIDGKLTVDKNSKLITNGLVAPFCVVDTTGSKTQSQVLALPGVPDGTEIASVTGTYNFGTIPPVYHTYWSLMPEGGKLSVLESDENTMPVPLNGAVIKLLSFVTPAATVSGVTVSPSTASIQKGNSQTFSAIVTGSNEPSQSVTWSVSGNQSQSTAIDQNGRLTVAADETASTISVKAASTDDTAKYGTAVVTVTSSGSSDNGGSGSQSSTASSVPSLPFVVTANAANGNAVGTATVNATVDISGASFPSGVTGVVFSVMPETSAGIPQGAAGGTANLQGAAVYRLAISDGTLNVIGTPVLYSLNLLDQNGNAVSFTGSVTVRIPVPAGLRGTPRVFRYEPNGTLTDMKAVVENGFLVFTTTHFSNYVIAGTGNSITLDTKSYQMPVNASYQIGVKLTGSKAATVKFRSTNEKTATVTKLKNGNYQVTGKNPGTAYIMYDVYDNKNKLLTHASVRVDVKTGIRARGDSTRQYGVY